MSTQNIVVKNFLLFATIGAAAIVAIVAFPCSANAQSAIAQRPVNSAAITEKIGTAYSAELIGYKIIECNASSKVAASPNLFNIYDGVTPPALADAAAIVSSQEPKMACGF